LLSLIESKRLELLQEARDDEISETRLDRQRDERFE
jgi:hypothetical protein